MNLLIDANVLINGIFEPNSYSYRILAKSSKGNMKIFLGQDTYDEVLRSIERVRSGKGVDLSPALQISLKQLRLSFLERVSDDELSTVSAIKGAGDQRIAVLASKYCLPICTNDVADFAAARDYGIEVFTPLQIIQRDGLALSQCLQGFLASPERGTAYFHFFDPAGKGKSARAPRGKIALFNWENFGTLWYEAAQYQLRFTQSDGFEICTKPSQPFTNGELKAAMSFDCNSYIYLQLGYRGRKARKEKQWVPVFKGTLRPYDMYLSTLPAGFHVGAFLPHPLTEKGCNNLMRGSAVSAPHERRSLEDIVDAYFKTR